ncbi:MAG TPA: ABC transporter ATP-binding protein [Mycobacteriales bacterium]|nr:ABC transporter ATP-binding protein [Mycobacteriales bacterium]HVX69750.1 ABC transporter ATP-binding protein [Mycobacteriales bacterium]
MEQRAAYLVRGLSKTYRGATSRANDGIDLEVPSGEIFGVLGPNGAGKTTLVRQLVGLVRPDQGEISLLGHDVIAEPRVAPRLVAYLAQEEPALAELDVRRAIETTGRLRGLSRREAGAATKDLLDELGLGGLADRPLTRLSGGQRRLACVASALVADRPVLILDEPTTGLDPVARHAVWSAIGRRRAEYGTTVLLVTHNVLEAETVLDRVAVIDRGRVIACDTPGRLKAAVDDSVRIVLVWHHEPPYDDSMVETLARAAIVEGRRWSVRLERSRVRDVLDRLTQAPLFDALEDYTVSTPSLEDVYLSLGGTRPDMDKQ